MKELKVLTLNAWRYKNWDKRKPILKKLLKDENPDIIFLQEAIYDEKKQEGGRNQVEQIANSLGYKHSRYGKLAKMKKDFSGEVLDRDVWFGNGIISKYPIEISKKVSLKKYENDYRSLGFLYGRVNLGGHHIDVLSVHFLNNDESSRRNLIESMNWVKKKDIKPIISGDFNIKDPKTIKENTGEDYEISYYKKKYNSYPVNETSYNEVPITLDYIVSNKDKFVMKNVRCIETRASDHNAVVANIKRK